MSELDPVSEERELLAVDGLESVFAPNDSADQAVTDVRRFILDKDADPAPVFNRFSAS